MTGTVLRIVLGVGVALTVYVIGASMLRKFQLAPPEEPDPDDIKPVNLQFRCIVCGAQVTMTAAQGDDPEAPRHCREDMVLIE
ncbi:MAG: hypothetical protein QOF40_3426 [Actinomycetota bacterium]|jgi:hypothetical protein|nr:hypothetical protein [Actinomycetota bacterium]